MRREPDCEIPEVKKRDKGLEERKEERKYEVITPIFGGGAEAGAHDEVTPVRGASIRGHLRFWWRACRGGEFNGDLKEMRKREDEIWGAASTRDKAAPSKVQIAVKVDKKGRDSKVYQSENRVNDGYKGIAYVVFPLAPDPKKSKPSGTLKEDVSFTLTLKFPEKYRKDVEAALWAWEMFGGVGGRTRRGFGAIARTDSKGQGVAQSKQELEEIISNGLKEYVVDGKWPKGVPHLSTKGKYYKVHDSKTKVWESLIEKLKQFRQYRIDKNSRQRKEQGISVWPEANAIRHITGLRKAETIKFPRAKFGLPIIFHFQSSRGQKEPEDTTLTFSKDGRLASPLILRPIRMGSRTFGVAILLETEGVPWDRLVLEFSGEKRPVKADLIPSEAKDIEALNGETDVLEAFLNTL